MRRTKIIATLGPASWDEPVLRELIAAGLDVARLNFAHGNRDTHGRTLDRVRRLAAEAGRFVGVLQDLGGSKLRTGKIAAGDVGAAIELKAGEHVVLVAGQATTEPGRIGVSHRAIVTETSPGQRIFLSDGRLELRIVERQGDELVCAVIRGGQLGSRQGINIPGAILSAVPAVTDKDWADLEWGLEHGVDFVALSFVRSPDDILAVKQRIAAAGASVWVIAKIEKPQALERIDEIIQAADGIMIARGDLGVELDAARVPLVQKELIRLANQHECPVITATQMLESMTESPRPTRAELSDVANAIFDGTDALMLSAETASGRFPVQALSMMADIATASDEYIHEHPVEQRRDLFAPPDNVGEAIGRAAERITRELDIRAIFVADVDGSRALAASKSRPGAQLLGLATDDRILRRMNLLWGVTPIKMPPIERGSKLLPLAEKLAVQRRLAQPGDWLVLLSGSPHTESGPTNVLRLHQIGALHADDPS